MDSDSGMVEEGALARRLRNRIEVTLAPVHLEVIDESSLHKVPAGTESHFRLVVVSDRFVGLTRIERHRLIHESLARELAHDIHALALRLFTPEEWQTTVAAAPSPPCARQR